MKKLLRFETVLIALTVAFLLVVAAGKLSGLSATPYTVTTEQDGLGNGETHGEDFSGR